ncbi:hypothetical protein AB0910_24355 [Streptomyces sp. NPDC047002]|uniref:hypothetical protein n=1 Tax=Streptomyces sp. NPDC047002 TaxID=3155475 RepID=UPI003455AF8B
MPVAVAHPWIGAAAVLCPVVLFCCVVLPGVWSANPTRRRDARVMVELLLDPTRSRRR